MRRRKSKIKSMSKIKSKNKSKSRNNSKSMSKRRSKTERGKRKRKKCRFLLIWALLWYQAEKKQCEEKKKK